MRKQYRQGDVFITAIPALPQKKKQKRENGILAYGEVTGHSHAISDTRAATVYEVGKDLYLSVTDDGGVAIGHQEHGDVRLPKGDYRVVVQREYTPEEIRNVLD